MGAHAVLFLATPFPRIPPMVRMANQLEVAWVNPAHWRNRQDYNTPGAEELVVVGAPLSWVILREVELVFLPRSVEPRRQPSSFVTRGIRDATFSRG